MVKKISLARGNFAIIDDDDYDYIAKRTWHLTSDGRAATWERRDINDAKKGHRKIWMHRLVNKTPSHLITDHKNGNKLDNRKINLRDATHAQNMANKVSSRGSSSKFKGVYFCASTKKWRANIRKDKQLTYLGQFEKETEAAVAYDMAAAALFNEYARFNLSVGDGL